MQISFHDPDGAVIALGERILRRTTAVAGERLRRFLATDLAAALQAEGWLVATKPIERPEDVPIHLNLGQGDCWFEHTRLDMVSYAHEWVPEMLIAAAERTLQLALRLRQVGWDLKDGSASNVVFAGTHAVFVDLCSVVERRDDTPSWWPAGQFERHFLLPLMAYLRHGLAPDQLHRSNPDGLSPEQLFRMGGWARWFSPLLLRHCTLPTLAARASQASLDAQAVGPERAEVNRVAQNWQLRTLGRSLRSLAKRLPVANSDWRRYTSTRHHYVDEALVAKRRAVESWVAHHRPAVVLDLGANTGEFSVVCSSLGARVVALERDLASARTAFTAFRREAPDALVMVQDLTQPSPAMGWRYAERRSLAERLEGQVDCVLCLALVHHLLVGGALPLEEIVAALARLTRRLAVIEFVGPDDPVFRKISRQRGLVFDDLDLAAFLRALSACFQVLEQRQLPGTTRVLVLCERKP
jgi:hypothetical protein